MNPIATIAITLDDAAAHFDNNIDMEGNQIVGLARGLVRTDAVNLGQLQDAIDNLEDKAFKGIAISNAMQVFLPDPGKRFRVTMGAGLYRSEPAIAIGASGRVTEDVALYVSLGSDVEFEAGGGKAGVSFQW